MAKHHAELVPWRVAVEAARLRVAARRAQAKAKAESVSLAGPSLAKAARDAASGRSAEEAQLRKDVQAILSGAWSGADRLEGQAEMWLFLSSTFADTNTGEDSGGGSQGSGVLLVSNPLKAFSQLSHAFSQTLTLNPPLNLFPRAKLHARIHVPLAKQLLQRAWCGSEGRGHAVGRER